jgi:hypothetical protein
VRPDARATAASGPVTFGGAVGVGRVCARGGAAADPAVIGSREGAELVTAGRGGSPNMRAPSFRIARVFPAAEGRRIGAGSATPGTGLGVCGVDGDGTEGVVPPRMLLT